jgi:hypothetical protein
MTGWPWFHIDHTMPYCVFKRSRLSWIEFDRNFNRLLFRQVRQHAINLDVFFCGERIYTTSLSGEKTLGASA